MDAIFDPPVRAARANAIAAGMEVEQLWDLRSKLIYVPKFVFHFY